MLNFRRSRISRSLFGRRTLSFALAFVLISITTMTLAYAALSTSLNITGTAEFKEASWSITITEASGIPPHPGMYREDGNVAYYGESSILSKPTVSGTSINNFRVQLTKPADAVWLFYKITNTGDIPARLESVTWSDPTYSSSTNNSNDIQLVQKNFWTSYWLFEVEGNSTYTIYEDTLLCPWATFEFGIGNGFDEEATQVPSSRITITNLNAQINFISEDTNLCDGSTPVGGIE